MNIDDIAKELGISVPSEGRAALPYNLVASYVKHQEKVLRVMAVLSDKYRYEQVVAAINASGASPDMIYQLLCANFLNASNKNTILTRFYEALNGSEGNEK